MRTNVSSFLFVAHLGNIGWMKPIAIPCLPAKPSRYRASRNLFPASDLGRRNTTGNHVSNSGTTILWPAPLFVPDSIGAAAALCRMDIHRRAASTCFTTIASFFHVFPITSIACAGAKTPSPGREIIATPCTPASHLHFYLTSPRQYRLTEAAAVWQLAGSNICLLMRIEPTTADIIFLSVVGNMRRAWLFTSVRVPPNSGFYPEIEVLETLDRAGCLIVLIERDEFRAATSYSMLAPQIRSQRL